MEQVTFADVEYEGKKRRTRREPGADGGADSVGASGGAVVRRRAGGGADPLAAMLRIHRAAVLQPERPDMLYEIERRFARLRLTGPLPDRRFTFGTAGAARARGLFEEINAHLAERGYRVRAGTIVDASIRGAVIDEEPGGGAGSGDATRKGNEWHFGMKGTSGWTRRRDWCMACGRRRRTRTIFGRRGRCFTAARTRATGGSRSG